jgi:hypothetical protein
MYKALQDDSIVAHENMLWFETILDLDRHDFPNHVVAVKAFSLMRMLSALQRMRGPVHKVDADVYSCRAPLAEAAPKELTTRYGDTSRIGRLAFHQHSDIVNAVRTLILEETEAVLSFRWCATSEIIRYMTLNSAAAVPSL